MAQTTNITNNAIPEIAEHEPAIQPGKARRLYFILGGAVLTLLVGYLIFAVLTAGKEATDDAQVAADVVSIAARVGGQLTNVAVAENQPVHRGQLLAEVDPQDAQVKLAQVQGDLATAEAQAAQATAQIDVTGASARGAFTAAQAAVQSSKESVDTSANMISEQKAAVARATANAEKARLDFGRAEELGAKGDISRAQVDAARAAHASADADLAQARAKLMEAENGRQAAQANVRQAEGRLQQSAPVGAQLSAVQAQARLAAARVRAAQAALHAAELTLSYTKIYAPSDGIASKIGAHNGAIIAAGQPILQLVPARTYVTANFKETQMSKIRPGQRAEVKIDSLGGKKFEAKVESLSGGTGASFSMLPPDNASGNFVKVVQRVPVRLSWNGPPANEVPVGSSAEVT
ncbi:MAG: HlyD family secretion protein, partial [Acidobacteriota bacterium]